MSRSAQANFFYDIYSGGTTGTLLAEYDAQSFISTGTDQMSFTPTVLPTGMHSPGELIGDLNLFGQVTLARVLYLDNTGGEIQAFFTTDQFPSSPGTYALTTYSVVEFGGAGGIGPTPDTLVVTDTTVPEPASLTLAAVGAASLLGYGWRRRTLAAT